MPGQGRSGPYSSTFGSRAIGRKGAAEVYAALVASVIAGVLPYMAPFVLLTLPLGFEVIADARKYYDQTENLIPVTAKNAQLTHLLPLLRVIGGFAS